MNKAIIVIVAIVVIAGLAGGGWFLLKKKPQDQTRTTVQTQAEQTGKTEDSGIGSEIKKGLLDLMTTGAGTKCTVEDKSGKYTMYAKGDKAKVEGIDFAPSIPGNEPKGEPGMMINDGTWAYMWSGKEGMKFNIKDMEETAKDVSSQPSSDSQEKATDWKDWVKEMQNSGAKYECSAAVLSDADFVPPADVKFQDWEELMKSMMQGFQQNMPQGVPPNVPQ
jgi:uncharacterized protein YxeA